MTVEIREEFVDPVTGGQVELVVRRGAPLWTAAAVVHPGCTEEADVALDLDAFFCRECGRNGRVSGAWIVALWTSVPSRHVLVELVTNAFAEDDILAPVGAAEVAVDGLIAAGVLVPAERLSELCHLCEKPIGEHRLDGRHPEEGEEEADVLDEILAERIRAHEKHGATSMESATPTAARRLSILVEEVGEVAKEFNDAEHELRPVDLEKLRKELIQVAAMAASWADACS